MTTSANKTLRLRRVGYVFEERYLWHTPWIVQFSPLVQPFQHWEHAETKRRFHNLLLVSGIYDSLNHLKDVNPVNEEDLQLVHTSEYIQNIKTQSARLEGGLADTETTFSQYAYDIAALAVGGAFLAAKKIMDCEVENAYVLCRPPGHHALEDRGMGFCIFNNIALTAKYLLKNYDSVKKIAIVDFDAHHGNGTQHIFLHDKSVLFISTHQASNFPVNSGFANELGEGEAKGTNINIPLPSGSGGGAFKYAFEKVVIPSLEKFEPDFILVSSGLDASYSDPLSSLILSSQDFAFMAKSLVSAAESLCNGKILFLHEGGYSEHYVPFCGLAVIEAMLGVDEVLKDPFLGEIKSWDGTHLAEHQKKVIDEVMVLHGLS